MRRFGRRSKVQIVRAVCIVEQKDFRGEALHFHCFVPGQNYQLCWRKIRPGPDVEQQSSSIMDPDLKKKSAPQQTGLGAASHSQAFPCRAWIWHIVFTRTADACAPIV